MKIFADNKIMWYNFKNDFYTMENCVKKFLSIKILFCSLIFAAFTIFQGFSQEVLADVYGKIDSAFKNRSTEQLNTVLKSTFGTEYYSLFESYALKKTRQLIIQGDLETARNSALVVIDNNLENFDAVELYSYIDKAILNQEAARLAEQRKAELEAARVAAQKEKTKKQVSKTFSTVSSSSGDKVYLSDAQETFSPMHWMASIGIADFLIQSITDPSGSGFKYGVAAEVDLQYRGEQFFFGGEIFGNFEFLNFSSDNKDTLATVKVMPKLAFPVLSKHLFFRLGFAAYMTLESDDTVAKSVGNLYSPNVGISWEDAHIGKALGKLSAEYCLGSLSGGDLKSAFDLGASIMIPMSESEHTRVGLKLGVNDLLMIKNSGIENRCNAIISIGVGNVN